MWKEKNDKQKKGKSKQNQQSNKDRGLEAVKKNIRKVRMDQELDPQLALIKKITETDREGKTRTVSWLQGDGGPSLNLNVDQPQLYVILGSSWKLGVCLCKLTTCLQAELGWHSLSLLQKC